MAGSARSSTSFSTRSRTTGAAISYGRGVTAAFLAALVILLLVVVATVVRERTHRSALDEARRHVTESTVQAEEDARLRHEAEESVNEHAASAASAESRLADLTATSGGRIEELEKRLRDAEAERLRVGQALAAQSLVAEAAAVRMAELEADSATSATARDGAAARVTELEREVEVLRSRPAIAPPAGDTVAQSSGGRRVERNGALGWHLLLARVERQWADAVNAGADERGVIDASPADQFAQAVERDLERLREEVGVQTTLTATKPAEDVDPLTTLLAVGEAVALLAYHSENLRVDLRNPAVVSGEDWSGDDDALQKLERLAATASVGGLPATVSLIDGVAQVTLGARP